MRKPRLDLSSHVDPFLRNLSFQLDPELQFASPVLRQGYEAWTAARGARPMPSRRDLDPVALPRALLSHILLVDIEREPVLRFRWRLIGTHVTERLGRDSTGRYWDELYADNVRKALMTGPLWAMERCRPIRTLGYSPVEGKGHMRSENLELPLSEDGETVNMIMTVTDYG